MKALEMFEKLEYKCNKSEHNIIYAKSNYDITFSLPYKEYYTNDGTSITVEEHLAIHQQMKELGWLDVK
jgi:hypothetical protein